jgi:glycosyltransferase involved in cell wall biosynthesis
MIRLHALEPAIAVRSVDLTRPLPALTDVGHATQTRIAVHCGPRLLGLVVLPNGRQPISRRELRDAIADQLGAALLARDSDDTNTWTDAWRRLTSAVLPDDPTPDPVVALPLDVPVTVAVCTYDRPDDLRRCLCSLREQGAATERAVELMVVDNHPASGQTQPVVREFPEVRYVTEERAGLAYARNAGFVAATGAICVMTDDDVTFPPGWLEQLLAPFSRQDVMAVTGNVLPLELDTPAQQLFEAYGGLGRGAQRFVADRSWFDGPGRSAVPTWALGATANAAVRLSVFDEGPIQRMHEALGPGTPTGVGEDTYLFYQILQQEYAIVYEPAAFVWHRHRRTRAALRRQIYNYSKGHVAYHLVTLLENGDVRGLARCLVELPKAFVQRSRARLRGGTPYPLSLLAVELGGTLAGAAALLRSYLRVRRLSPSRTRREARASRAASTPESARS